jgi:hypothetical protein
MNSQLITRLFVGLAVLAIGLALASPTRLETLYTPTMVIVIHPSPKKLQIIAALVGAVSALAFLVFGRRSAHSMDNALGRLHFILLAVGVVSINLAAASVERIARWKDNSYNPGVRLEGIRAFLLLPWPVRLLTIGLWSIELACLVFAVNLGMTGLSWIHAARSSG